MVGLLKDIRDASPRVKSKMESDILPTMEIAQDYMDSGFHVIPIFQHNKRPACRWKAVIGLMRPYDDSDKQYILNIFKQMPLNIGIACGGDKGLVVLDFDVAPSYEAWAEKYSDVAKICPTAKTNRGYHVLIQNSMIPNGRKLIMDDKPIGDIKSDGGYFVAAPSMHSSGAKYEWLAGQSILEIELPIIDSLESIGLAYSKTRKDAPDYDDTVLNPDAVIEPYQGNDSPKAINVMTKQFDLIATAEDGFKRVVLFNASFTAGGFVAIGELERDSIEQKLFVEICKRDIKDSAAALETIRDGIALGITKPFAKHSENESHQTLDELNPEGKTAIQINNTDLITIANACWGALIAANNPPIVFVRGGRLVRLHGGDDENAIPYIQILNKYSLRNIIEPLVFCHTHRGENITQCFVPLDVIQSILNRSDFTGVSELKSVVTHPIVESNGNIQYEPGYNAATKTYYFEPLGTLDVGDIEPTKENVVWAKDFIDGWVGDFPFVGPSKTNFVAMYLLNYVLGLIDDVCPMHIINAPTPGTGKTLLAALSGIAANGKSPGMLTVNFKNTDETRKQLVSALQRGNIPLIIDNVTDIFGDMTINAMLTQKEYVARILGHNEDVSVYTPNVWVATGNNVSVQFEMARRVVWINMDAGVQYPWQRTGFNHSNITEWTIKNRPLLVRGALILINNWLYYPPQNNAHSTFGSFERWFEIINGIMTVNGYDDFMANQTDMYESNTEDSYGDMQLLINTWWTEHESSLLSASDVFKIAKKLGVVESIGGTNTNTPSAFAKHVKQYEGNVFNGKRLNIKSYKSTQPSKYFLKSIVK